MISHRRYSVLSFLVGHELVVVAVWLYKQYIYEGRCDKMKKAGMYSYVRNTKLHPKLESRRGSARQRLSARLRT